MTFMTWTAAQFGTRGAAPGGGRQQIFAAWLHSHVTPVDGKYGTNRNAKGVN
jgi:hypothetical protein